MKLAVSNIAWKPEREAEALDLLLRHVVQGLEVAPSLILPGLDPAEARPGQAAAVRKKYESRGLPIVAMQALLFGYPDLAVFGPRQVSEATAARLEGIIRLAGDLGDGIRLVFGSPRNRLKGNLSREQVMARARSFFGRLGQAAEKAGTFFCLEPNASAYGADYATSMAESLEVIQAVDHPGFGLNVDAGVLTMNGEDYLEALRLAKPYMHHVHISEPFLGCITDAKTNHPALAAALHDMGWDGYVSIEMKSGLGEDDLALLDKCLQYVREVYFT